jgi:hypothetical protein
VIDRRSARRGGESARSFTGFDVRRDAKSVSFVEMTSGMRSIRSAADSKHEVVRASANRFAAIVKRSQARNHVLAACTARAVLCNNALNIERAQGRPDVGRHPRPACNKERRRQSPQVQPDQPAFPCASGLRLTSRSPQGPAFLPLSLACLIEHATLAPAPGRQDHTTSPSAKATLVQRSLHVHRSPPLRIVTTRTSLFDEAG